MYLSHNIDNYELRTANIEIALCWISPQQHIGSTCCTCLLLLTSTQSIPITQNSSISTAINTLNTLSSTRYALETAQSRGLGHHAPPMADQAKNNEAPSTTTLSTSQQIVQRKLSWGSIAKSLVAGGVAGAVSRTAVAPLERLKILMQVQGNEQVYKGVWQGLMHMWKADGMKGMFKGNGTNCIRIIPNSAVKFLTYEQLSRRISLYLIDNGGDGQMTPGLRLAAGAGAGIIGMSATYPLDMVRGRLTVQEGTNQQYRGIWHATRVIVQEEGLIALWRGWLPSVIGVIPYVGLNFAVYETLKEVVLRYHGLDDERQLSVVTRLGCGGVAGTMGQTVAYPLDVVRRRLQMSGWSGAKELHADHGKAIAYRGMTDCFVRTVREEGMQALFKGLGANYLKVVPSIAIAFVTYEQCKEFMGVELRISS